MAAKDVDKPIWTAGDEARLASLRCELWDQLSGASPKKLLIQARQPGIRGYVGRLWVAVAELEIRRAAAGVGVGEEVRGA